MKYCLRWVLLVSLSLNISSTMGADEAQPNRLSNSVDVPVTVDEARARARLLHETIHGTLHVVHRDFFDEDDAHAIPSASLEDVFHELTRSFGVEVKWLNVHTDLLNVDHQPQGRFEKNAVKALAEGRQNFEATERGEFRYAGRIRLSSQCLKCHLKNRTTNDDRAAGLLISIPLRGARNVLRPSPESK
jgi:hypothetical protein